MSRWQKAVGSGQNASFLVPVNFFFNLKVGL